MRKLLLLVLCYFAFQQLDAQQLPLFNQYREYPGFVNPAAVNIDFFTRGTPEKMLTAGGGSRLQWVGNKDFTIQTSILHTESLYYLDGVSLALGGFFLQDKVDVTAMNGFYGRGAVYIGEPSRSSFWGGLGFNVGYVHHRIDIQKLKAYHGNDPLLQAYAPLSSASYDVGVGAFGVFPFKSDDNGGKTLLLGVSIPQIMEPEVKFLDGATYDYNLIRHVFTQITFLSSNSSDLKFFEASLWGKWVEGLGAHVDLNIRRQVNGNLWLGGGASSSGTFHLEIGTNLKLWETSEASKNRDNFVKIGYGFDVPFNTRYASYLGASHELHCSFIIY